MKHSILQVTFFFGAMAYAAPIATSMSAHPHCPSDGKVSIAVTFSGESNEVAKANCSFSATNFTTQTSFVPANIDEDSISGSDTTWTRRFVWNVATDVGEAKICDIAIVVKVRIPLGGVQLWEKGPYWAECNVGANHPEEYGSYFWWGDTVGYTWKGGVWCSGNQVYQGVTWVSSTGENMSSSPFGQSSGCPTYGKGNSSLLSLGYIDSTGCLANGHDAAKVRLGSPWHMPTDTEMGALINNCESIWTNLNGVSGRLVSGKGNYASESIFIPAAGYGNDNLYGSPNTWGTYWSSTSDSEGEYSARCLSITSDSFAHPLTYRCGGHSIRAVREFDSDTSQVTTCFVIDLGGLNSNLSVSFVAPNGRSSLRSALFATNGVYGALPDARRAGFTFAGWYTALDGTNRVTAFSPVDPKVTTLYARWVEDDASLYAQWSANAYTVSFDANGGDGIMVAQPFLYDQVQPLSGSSFAKLGYTFKGWSTSPDGEIVYSDKASVSNLTAEAGFAVALFAKWDKVIDVATETIEDWVAYDLALKFKKPGESGSAYRKRFEAKYGDDYSTAFFRETGKIGMDGTRLCVWHDYVAGTDPLDDTSKFTASVTIVDGKPVVTYSPELSEEEKALRVYKTLGKAKLLDSEWVEVPSGHESEYHFFKVTVEMK